MTSHGESSGCSAGSRPLCVPTHTTQHPTLQHPNTPTPTTHYTYRIPQYTYRIPLQEGAFDFLLYVGAMMVIYTHD